MRCSFKMNQYFILITKIAFDFESDVSRNSFSDCTGFIPLSEQFPVSMIPERFRSSAVIYLFIVHWNQSFRMHFLAPYYYMKQCKNFLKMRECETLLRDSFSSRFGYCHFPLLCGSPFLRLHSSIAISKSQHYFREIFYYFSSFRKTYIQHVQILFLTGKSPSAGRKKLLCPGSPEQRSSCCMFS